jgi:prophage tail gpP-like protein
MGEPVHRHRVSVVAGGKVVPGWKSYTVSVDMLQPADAFDLSVRFTREAWDLLSPDTEVGIFVDSTRILTGYIGTRSKVPSDSGTMLQITGRDKTGRLVDESAALFKYGGLYLKQLAEKIVGISTDDDPLFERVTLRNTKNRSLLRNVKEQKIRVNLDPLADPFVGAFRAGAGVVGVTIPDVKAGHIALDVLERETVDLDPIIDPIAYGAREAAALVGVQIPAYKGGAQFPGANYVKKRPIITPGIFKGRSGPKKVQPGQSRWAVLEEFLREARLLAWSTADGTALFIGLPTYDQGASFDFFEASGEEKTQDRAKTNCRISIIENVEEMYSLYLACGAAKGSGSNYGPNVTKKIGRARNNPRRKDGLGVSFKRPKTLLITDDGIRSQRDAQERAEREQLQREAGHFEVEIDTVGHGQIYDGNGPMIYAVDTICKVTDQDTGFEGACLITALEFSGDDKGTRTQVRAVPKGTLLSL